MKTAIELIGDERERQYQEEGYSERHDDEHEDGELARAAACYALPDDYEGELDGLWPWDPSSCRRSNRIRDLVKAGALIVAEIERLQRIEAKK